MQGRSFLPLLRGEVSELREAVLAERTYHDRCHPMRCVRTVGYNRFRSFNGSTQHRVFGGCMAGASREPGIDRLLHRAPGGPIALHGPFDRAADPHETTNLAYDEGCEAVRAGWRRRLTAWMRRAGDGLLDGPNPGPFCRQAIEPMQEA